MIQGRVCAPVGSKVSVQGYSPETYASPKPLDPKPVTTDPKRLACNLQAGLSCVVCTCGRCSCYRASSRETSKSEGRIVCSCKVYGVGFGV